MINVRSATRVSLPAVAGTDRRILVVEDQRSIAQLLAAMIEERWHVRADIATSLEETRALVTASPDEFLVASCDLHLPDAPYGEIIDYLHGVGIRTIALSGAYGDELRETMLNKGAIDLVRKDNINSFEYVTELVGRLCNNRNFKVLVADDSMIARAMFKHTLERLCFQVFTANDGQEALEVLARNPDIRLLLADYNMPTIDGFALTVEVRKKFGKDQLAIIGVSVSDDPKISARFINCGANDFIRRPYSHEEFVCRVNQNVEMLELLQANREAAYRDFLTGLFNRRYFFQIGVRMHTEARRRGQLVLAMIDVDRFKDINDRYGHPSGDAALRHLAAMLKSQFADALVARVGGEEFAILLEGSTIAESRTRLEAFQQDLRDTPLEADGKVIELAVSVGLTDEVGESLDQMIGFADSNLYQAKQAGRDRTVG